MIQYDPIKITNTILCFVDKSIRLTSLLICSSVQMHANFIHLAHSPAKIMAWRYFTSLSILLVDRSEFEIHGIRGWLVCSFGFMMWHLLHCIAFSFIWVTFLQYLLPMVIQTTFWPSSNNIANARTKCKYLIFVWDSAQGMEITNEFSNLYRVVDIWTFIRDQEDSFVREGCLVYVVYIVFVFEFRDCFYA